MNRNDPAKLSLVSILVHCQLAAALQGVKAERWFCPQESPKFLAKLQTEAGAACELHGLVGIQTPVTEVLVWHSSHDTTLAAFVDIV